MAENLIYQRISEIMDEVEVVKKERKNSQQNYMFRGIDDMYNAIHPLFKKHKVFIVPNIIESKREERNTSKGGILIYTIAKYEYSFCTTDGSSIKSTIEGEGMDSGDKSTNKAMSAALKYVLMQMFLIPTDELKDSEDDSHKPISIEGKIEQWMDEKTFEAIKNQIANAKNKVELKKASDTIAEWRMSPKGTKKAYAETLSSLGKARQIQLNREAKKTLPKNKKPQLP